MRLRRLRFVLVLAVICSTVSARANDISEHRPILGVSVSWEFGGPRVNPPRAAFSIFSPADTSSTLVLMVPLYDTQSNYQRTNFIDCPPDRCSPGFHALGLTAAALGTWGIWELSKH
jgi:hypothetical protein